MRPIVVLLVLVALAAPTASSADAAGPDPRQTDVVAALSVLHRWDARRARAWAAADEEALRSLYAPGSLAARSDVRLLRSYTARRLVVRRLVTQVFGVRVLRREPDHLVIRVRDRVAGGSVATGTEVLALPSTPPAQRRVDLRRIDSTWRVASVSR